MKVQGAVALITGGSLGIGRAISSALLDLGARVSFVDINNEEGSKAQRRMHDKHGEENVLFVQGDVANAQDLEQAFEETKKAFGRIDIVCNNAGIIDEENWEKCIDINFTAVIRGTMLGLKYFRNNNPVRGGVIINVASAAGLFPTEWVPVYSATKTGVVGFTRSLGNLSATDGIRVTALCPFFTDTPLVQGQFSKVENEEVKRFYGIDKTGLLTPEYVAQGAVKLIEDEDNAGQALFVYSAFKEMKYFNFGKQPSKL